MTLREFMVMCRVTPELSGSWERLYDAAYSCLHEKLEQEPDVGKLSRYLEDYQAARKNLLGKCGELNVQPPDLSLAAFSGALLRYHSTLRIRA